MLSYKYNIEGATCIKLFSIRTKEKNVKLKNKNSRIKANKIISYINMLSKYGTNLGDTYIKHLQEDIWELRPLRDRILFAFVRNNKIVLLTTFMKKTQKTSKSELERAKKVLKKFIERGDESE